MDMWLVPHRRGWTLWVHHWRYIGVVILGPLAVVKVPSSSSPLLQVTWPGRMQHYTIEAASSAKWGRRPVHAGVVGAKANAAKHPIGDGKQDEL